MGTKTKFLGVTGGIVALWLTVSAAHAHATNTHIKMNGKFASVFFVDPDGSTNGITVPANN